MINCLMICGGNHCLRIGCRVSTSWGDGGQGCHSGKNICVLHGKPKGAGGRAVKSNPSSGKQALSGCSLLQTREEGSFSNSHRDIVCSRRLWLSGILWKAIQVLRIHNTARFEQGFCARCRIRTAWVLVQFAVIPDEKYHGYVWGPLMWGDESV